MYRIGEFSRLTQTPIKTLRYYDAIGLLRPARVDPSTSYRYYTSAEVERLNRILVFRDLGFPLGEIRTLMAENVPPDQIRGMLRLRCHELERTVDRERGRLARAAARLSLIEQSGHTAAHDVAVREAGPRLVASVRDTLGSYDECERLFDEIAHEVGPASPAGSHLAHLRRQRRGHRLRGVRVPAVARVRAAAACASRSCPGTWWPRSSTAASRSTRQPTARCAPGSRPAGRRSWGPSARSSWRRATDGESVTEIQFPIAPLTLGRSREARTA